MPTIGRNDPCPCGSGRKYKNCCLAHDRIAEQRDLTLTRTQARDLTLLYNYARQFRFNQDIMDGFNLYWGAVFEPAAVNEVGPENMRRFFEWFVHDYPTRPDKAYIIDLFIETNKNKLPDEDLALLEAWQKSVMGMWRVVSSSQGSDLLVFDVLREKTLTVRDPVFARTANLGDILIGRLYELNGMNYLSHMTMALPAAYELELETYIMNAYQGYGSELGEDSSLDQFLRAHSSLFNAFLVSERSSHLRHLIGPGTPYADPRMGRERLDAATSRIREEKLKEAAAEKQHADDSHYTASGILLPGSKPEAQIVKPSEKQPSSSKILIPGRDI